MKVKFVCLIFLGISVFGSTRMQGQEKSPSWGVLSKFNRNILKSSAIPNRKVAEVASGRLNPETNLPRSGDRFIKQEAPYRSPGAAGEEAVWDFRSLAADDTESPVSYFETPQSPLSGVENRSVQTYRISGDTLLLDVDEDPQTFIRLEKPEEVMVFPVRFGEERRGHFYGKGKYCERLELDVAGLNYTLADGFGTLILPGNDTIRDAVRVYTAKATSVYSHSITPEFEIDSPRETPLTYEEVLARLEQDSARMITESYRWYAPGNRYPVLEIVRKGLETNGEVAVLTEKSYIFHPLDQQWLPEDEANRTVLEKQRALDPSRGTITGNETPDVSLAGIRTYPNPVHHELSIALQPEQAGQVQVSLYSLQGQRVLHQVFQVESGSHVETLEMGSLPRGSYMLVVQAGDKSERKVIVKQ